MHWFLVQISVFWIDAISKILVEVLGNERSDAGHEGRRAQQDVKEDVQTSYLFLNTFVTLHARPIKSDVPVGKLLQEVQQRWHNIVKLVAVHFTTDVFDEVLISRNDPTVHEIVVSSERRF